MRSPFFSPKCPACGDYLPAYIRERRQNSEIEKCDSCSSIVRFQSYKSAVWLIFSICLIPNNLIAFFGAKLDSEGASAVLVYLWFFIAYIFCYKIQFFEEYNPTGEPVFRDMKQINPFKRMAVYTLIYIVVFLVLTFLV